MCRRIHLHEENGEQVTKKGRKELTTLGPSDEQDALLTQ